MSETEVAARRPRGPRGEFTVGDLLTAKRLGLLDKAIAENKGNPAFDKALRQMSAKDPSVAAAAGIGEGETVLDKRSGLFVSCKALGAGPGSKVRTERVGDTIVVRLA